MQGNCQRNNFSSSASNFNTQIYDTYSDHQDHQVHQNIFKSFVGATNIEMNFKVHKWGKLRKIQYFTCQTIVPSYLPDSSYLEVGPQRGP